MPPVCGSFCLSRTRHSGCRIRGPGLHKTAGVYRSLIFRPNFIIQPILRTRQTSVTRRHTRQCSLYVRPRIPISFLFQKSRLLALLDVSPLSIAKCHPHTESHDSQGWQQKYDHALTDSFSPVFRGCLGRAAAHGAPLTENGRRPQKNKHAKNGKLTSHFTPR